MAEGAHRPVLPARAVRLGAVLDDKQAAFGGQVHDRIHGAGPAGQVYADDGPGARGEHRADGCHGDVLRVPVHIGEHRHRAAIDDGRGRGQEGARRDHHLVARPDTECQQRRIQGHRAVGQGDGVFRTGPDGELAFEISPLLAGPVVDPVRKQHIADGIRLFRSKIRPGGKGCVQHVSLLILIVPTLQRGNAGLDAPASVN